MPRSRSPGPRHRRQPHWPGQSGFGPITLVDVYDLLEVNAARDWIWFAAHNDLTAEQRQVLTDVPRWPRLRESGIGRTYAEAIERVLAGDRDWAQQFAVTQFRGLGGRPPEGTAW
jgi:hypothetical protein